MPHTEFAVDTENRTGVVLVTVQGDIDIDSSDRLFAQVAEAVERGDDGSTLVLDLSEVTFADSTGLTALVRCARLTPGRLPVLIGATEAVASPLRSTGLDALFELRSTYEITAPHVFDLGDLPEREQGREG
jgi:anti-sigma B factor antagonist